MDGKKIVRIGSYIIGGIGLIGGAVMSVINAKNNNDNDTERNNDTEVLEPDRID